MTNVSTDALWRLAARFCAGVVALFLMLPLLVVVLFSFSERSYFSFPPTGFSLKWYGAAWQSGLFLAPAARSLALAVLATALAAAFALPAALGVRRMRPGVLRGVIEFACLSPLIVPALIIGIALLYSLTRLRLIDTFTGLLASHLLLVFPFMFRALLTSAVALRPSLLEASEILGASPATTLRRVVLPALVPGLVAGGIFSVIVSLDQFTVSLFVTQSEQVVLPVALYKYLFDVNDPVAAAVSTVLVVFGLLAAVVIDRLGWLRHLAGSGA
ncbi:MULTISPECIES: ABC transporter permease subunit [unclassified Variovorax]|uniref:ABC transporter permease n=1 Tax=unclassified Variovorax TaxID=663243 RepID=UPI002577A81A|nr:MULTISPECIES: ABC transporter permease subunit [unclassified Variovorax]MDM0091343.1 ABC transporter permease subunit [Variovorax sp. J22G40]MDM0149430.1 ABC transporter permease subunit [Variovorax sp. J2P1-31]